MPRPSRSLTLSLALLLLPPTLWAQSREEKVRADRKKVEAEGFWIYNNLEAGIAQGKATGKPLLVVLRCIPCEECVKLDDDLLEQDPVVRSLLDRFVCVRLVSTNGLDLSLFQFDTDQSFAVFLLNADKTIYGRFGTRSHRTEWVGDVSLKGLAAALQGALALHAQYPENRQQLSGKRGPEPTVRAPEQFPSLKGKYKSTLNYSGNVVQSCIHCHQIGEAVRDEWRAARQPFSEVLLFPYPHPKSIGMILDPDQRATIKEVVPGSPAAAAGLQAGDVIERLHGQPLLSIADVQWVLHQTKPEGAQLPAQVKRGDGSRQQLTLSLPKGWRQANDLSWRSQAWAYRRMATGGLLLEEATDQERSKAGVPAGAMALRAQHVGQFGPHAAAKQAGFVKGDLILSFDGRTDLLRESDLFHHALTNYQPGDQVPVVLWRDGQKLTLKLPQQN